MQDDEVTALGAQLTFYLVLALFPFLVFFLTLVSYTPLAGETALPPLLFLFPAETRDLIVQILRETARERSPNWLSFGALVSIWAASRGMLAVIRSVNKAYDIEETRPFWKVRAISILYTFLVAVVILLALLLVVFGQPVGQRLYAYLGWKAGFPRIWAAVQWIVPMAVMVSTFGFLYRSVPNRRLTVREVLPGAVFATAGWILVSFGVSLYVQQFDAFSRIYGSLGGMMALLLWLYLNGVLLIVGGELNASLASMRNGRTRPLCKDYRVHLPFLKKWFERRGQG